MSDNNRQNKRLCNIVRGWFGRLIEHWRLATAMLGCMFVGVGAFATWQTVIEHTNHTAFCITCHVMRDTVYQDYLKSSHYKNKFGVHVGCPDCHVPIYSWIDEAMEKVGTVGELYAFFVRGITTAEAFEPERAKLARHTWAKFEATNARECRHCHDYGNMIAEEQKPSARVSHADAAKTDRNCVQCHKGITHRLPAEEKSATPANDSFDVD